VNVRAATPADATALAALLAAYLAERFPGHAGTPTAQLERVVLSGATPSGCCWAPARGSTSAG
jgi:hypothetical protein